MDVKLQIHKIIKGIQDTLEDSHIYDENYYLKLEEQKEVLLRTFWNLNGIDNKYIKLKRKLNKKMVTK